MSERTEYFAGNHINISQGHTLQQPAIAQTSGNVSVILTHSIAAGLAASFAWKTKFQTGDEIHALKVEAHSL